MFQYILRVISSSTISQNKLFLKLLLFIFLKFFFFYFLTCVLPPCVSVDHIVLGACGCHKRALDLLKLELWMVVNYCVGTGN